MMCCVIPQASGIVDHWAQHDKARERSEVRWKEETKRGGGKANLTLLRLLGNISAAWRQFMQTARCNLENSKGKEVNDVSPCRGGTMKLLKRGTGQMQAHTSKCTSIKVSRRNTCLNNSDSSQLSRCKPIQRLTLTPNLSESCLLSLLSHSLNPSAENWNITPIYTYIKSLHTVTAL